MSPLSNTAGIKTVVILLSFVFLFVVAILLDLQYLYLMAVTLAVLPLASYGLAFFAVTRFNAVREHPPTASEGRAFSVTLRVTARGGLPQGALRVSDRLPEFVRNEAAESRTVPLDSWDGHSGEMTYRIVAEKRGVYQLGPATIHTTDPLGLFGFAAPLTQVSEITVHPVPLVSTEGMVGGEGRVGRRERDGKTHRGEGMDFHGVREYRTGDSLRRVHWPTTARTGQLSVIDFERAFQQDAVIALDASRGTDHGSGRATTLEYAVKIAATVADRTLRAGGGVTLVTQGTVCVTRSGDDIDTSRFRLFEILARLRANAETSLLDSLILARPADGSFITLITSWGEPHIAAYLTRRGQRGDRVSVIFVEPSSFGGGPAASPAVAGAELRVIRREDDPWQEGGRRLANILRQPS